MNPDHSSHSSSTLSHPHPPPPPVTASRIPLSVSTRSMSKLATHRLDRFEHATKKIGTGSALPRSRVPLMSMMTNSRQSGSGVESGLKAEGGKRKAEHGNGSGSGSAGRARKLVRYSEEKIQRSTTPKYTRPSHSLRTPDRSERHTSIRAPTPARDLLRRKHTDETTSPTISPTSIVPNPPTPPRPHMTISTLMPITPKRPRSPADMDETSSSVRKLDFSKGGMQSPIRRAFTGSRNGTGTIQRHSMQQTLIAPSTLEVPKMDSLQPPSSPSGLLSPRRALAGLSRLRMPVSPLAPRSPAATNGVLFGETSHSRPVDMQDQAGQEDVHKLDLVIMKTPELELAVIAQPSKPMVAETHPPFVPTEATQSITTVTGATQEDSKVDVDVSMQEEQASSKASVPAKAVSQVSTREPGSMAPPCRIPVSSRIPRPTMSGLPRSTTMVPTLKKAETTFVTKKPPTSLSAQPGRRPSSRPAPSSTASSSYSVQPSKQDSEPAAIRRKPSYPSSLGSGPLALPTMRMVSNPVLPPRDIDIHMDDNPPVAGPRQSPRSVSAPARSLSISTSRREGLSMSTSETMTGLSAALQKLKVQKRPEGSEPVKPRMSVSCRMEEADEVESKMESHLNASMSISTSKRLSSVHRPRQSLAVLGDVSMSSEQDGNGHGPADRSLAALLCSTSGGGCLKGVVAYVDVWTAEGADSSGVFSDMLKSLGARVLSRLTENVTHIIYKSGRPTTLSFWRKQDPRPHIVGISWVLKVKEKGERLEEGRFSVEVAEEDIFQKRRKSMEPKALANSTGLGTRPSVLLDLSVAQARRESLLYAPRISSPLKKGYVQKGSDTEDEGYFSSRFM